MTIEEFYNTWNGKLLEYNGDQYKYQCMDLFWQYIKDVQGVNPRPFQGWGTAKNCWDNFYNIKGASDLYERIENTPTNIPQKGDIVFWGFYPFVTGAAGHVAIFNEGGVRNFNSFDQNYPTNTPCHFQPHSYKGVKGWLRKKV